MTSIELPIGIVSTQDIARVEQELISFATWFQQNAIKQRMHLTKGTAMPGLSAEAIELLRSVSVDNNITQQQLDNLRQAIASLRQKSQTITITLAAPAPSQLKQQIVSWCRQEIHAQSLIDFRFNSTLLGGMVVRFGSHVYDWSWRRTLLAHKNDFTAELRRV